MSLEEYTKQHERLAPGTVILKTGEYRSWKVGHHAPKHARKNSGLNVEVSIPDLGTGGFRGLYFVPEGESILFTTDDDGNKKAPSVFALETPVQI